MQDPRNGPDFDLPPPVGPVRTWMLASTPRTGSTLLGRALADCGRCGVPTEWTNPMQLRDWGASAWLGGGVIFDAALEAHLQRVRARRTSNGWMAIKIHRHHWVRQAAVRRWFGDGPVVHLRRRDREAQAVSWAKALQTGFARNSAGFVRRPVYSRTLIRAALRRIERDDAAWAHELRPRRPLVLFYEDVVADLRSAVIQVLHHLGEPIPEDLRVNPTQQPQSDAVNADWLARFRFSR